MLLLLGQSGKTRTCNLLTPNQDCYRLHHTPTYTYVPYSPNLAETVESNLPHGGLEPLSPALVHAPCDPQMVYPYYILNSGCSYIVANSSWVTSILSNSIFSYTINYIIFLTFRFLIFAGDINAIIIFNITFSRSNCNSSLVIFCKLVCKTSLYY